MEKPAIDTTVTPLFHKKNFTKNIIVTTVTYTLRSIKKNLTHLHKVYHNNSLLDFRRKKGGGGVRGAVVTNRMRTVKRENS